MRIELIKKWVFGPALLGLIIVLLFPALARADLIAYYPFNGNVVDASGHGHIATVHNATIVNDGYHGQAYYFNGTDAYIDLALDINPATYPSLTMGAWVKVAAGGTDPIRAVISQDNGSFDRTLGLDNRSGGGWAAFTGSGVNASGINPGIDQWYFLTVVYDQPSKSVTLYVDQQSFSASGSPGSGWSYTWVGKNPSFDKFFMGTIDDVFFFDQALNAAEINEIRQNGIVPLPSTLLLVGSGLLGLGPVRRLVIKRK